MVVTQAQIDASQRCSTEHRLPVRATESGPQCTIALQRQIIASRSEIALRSQIGPTRQHLRVTKAVTLCLCYMW